MTSAHDGDAIRHNDLVTVGMPVRNGAEVMARALDSLLAQSWTHLEIVISDNGSTDGTGDLAAKYARRDSRVRYIRQTRNIGAQANFEFVLGVARGEYFMWAAVDDVWEPQFVEELRKELEGHADSDVAMSAVARFWADGSAYDVVSWQGRDNPAKLSHFSLGLKLANGKPYHLFIYGLYRTRFLVDAFLGLPAVIAADRLFVCQNALATKFRYVDRILHRRQLSRVPLTQRYLDDDVGRAWTDSFSEWKFAFAGGLFLARSKVIPWTRKIYLPIIVALFVKRAVMSVAARMVRRARVMTKGGASLRV